SEVLRDEIYLLAHKASETGTTFVRHEVYEDMVHAFQMFNFLESSVKAMNSVGHFVRTVIPIHQKATSRPQASHREYTPFVPRLPLTIQQQNAEWSFANSFEQLLIPRSQISVGHEKPACTECDESSVLRTSISSIMGYPHFTPIPLKTPIETTNFAFHNPNLLLSQQREYSSPQNPSTPPARFTHIQNQTHVSLNNRRHQRIESQRSQPTINPLRSSRCSVLKQLYLDYNEHPAVNTNFVKINGTTDEFINSDVNCNYNIEYDSELDGDGNDDGRSIHSVDVSVYTGSYFGE
ncbi:9591_t:CDS:2, partial [Acaulospora morrowiae]